MSWLKKTFCPKWRTVKLFKTQYEVKKYDTYQIEECLVKHFYDYFVCEVQYSEIRNDYRILETGYIPNNPHASEAYLNAVNYLNSIKSKLQNDYQ